MFKVKEGLLVGGKVVTGSGATEVLTAADVGTMAYQNATSFNVDVVSATSVRLDDTDSSYFLSLQSTSTMSADRQLTIDVNDATRILNITGNSTLSGTNTGDQTISFGSTGLTGALNGTVAGTLLPTSGGTGLNSILAVGELYYGNNTSAMGRISPVSPGSYLASNGNSAPVWTAFPAINNGSLSVTIGTTGGTNTTITMGTSSGFTSNTAGAFNYDVKPGPSLVNLAAIMTGGAVGFMRKSAQDTYTLDNFSYTSANSGNALVQRDAGGSFSAGTITAALSGTASNASNLGGYPRRIDLSDWTTWDAAKSGPVGWYGFTGGPNAGHPFYHGWRTAMADAQFGTEIAVKHDTDNIYFRRYAGNYGGWQELVHQSNFAAYVAATSGIIPNAGNSATATLAVKASTLSQNGGSGAAMTFNWSGQPSQPSWLWGGNDGNNMYVYNPSNFSVAYAGYAGYVSQNLTFSANGDGHGATSTYNGSAARTISYNSIGAASSGHTHTGYLDVAANRLYDLGNGANYCSFTNGRLYYTGTDNVSVNYANTAGNAIAAYGKLESSLSVNYAAAAGNANTLNDFSTSAAATANTVAVRTSSGSLVATDLYASFGYISSVQTTSVSASDFIGGKRLTLCYGQGAVNTNLALGNNTLISNTTGAANVAVGSAALLANITGPSNTAVGTTALAGNRHGAYNVAVGHLALANNGNDSSTSCNYNVAIGYMSLVNNVTGYNNIAIGFDTQSQGQFTYYNIAVGHQALRDNLSISNIAIGNTALRWNTSGAYNVGIGTAALLQNTTAYGNVAIGNSASEISTTGAYNTCIGASAGAQITTGSGNVVIGSMRNDGVYSPAASLSNHNNYVSIGNTSTAYAAINVGWTTLSDARDKTEFGIVPHGLDFITELTPISYKFRTERGSEETNGRKRYGFKAQDILALEGVDSVIVDSTDPDKLRFNADDLTPVLVNAIKELLERVKVLEGKLHG